MQIDKQSYWNNQMKRDVFNTFTARYILSTHKLVIKSASTLSPLSYVIK